MDINIYDDVVYLQGTVLSTNCKNGWNADNFELSISDSIMRGSKSDTKGSGGNNVVLRKQ